MQTRTAERRIAAECQLNGIVKPSRLFPAIRKIYSGKAADRIIALMGNGVSLKSALTCSYTKESKQ